MKFAVTILKLAPGVGIEPTIAESKSVVLPLHYPGSKLTGLLLTSATVTPNTGMEPVTRSRTVPLLLQSIVVNVVC